MRSPEQSRTRASPGRGGRSAAWLLGGVLGLAPAPANALPTIAWEAPAGCPEAQRVDARIRQVIGARPVSPAVTAVRARVERQADRWLLVVVFTGRDGSTERRLALHDCEATADATAVLVGIALVGAPASAASESIPQAVPVPEGPERAVVDASAVEGRPRAAEADATGDNAHSAGAPGTGAGENVQTRPAATERAPKAARGRPAAPTSAARVRAFVQVGPAVAAGVLPRATPGLTAALGVALPRLRVALGYARWFRSAARWADDRQVGADLSLHAVSLRAGPVRRVGPVELQAAVGVEFGALRAVGVGAEVNLDQRTWWGATLVGGGLAWAPRALRGHGALLVTAELVVPLHRPTLLFNSEPIFRLGAVGMRAGVLLEARLF